MNKKVKNTVLVGLFSLYIILFFGWCILKEDVEYSESERRTLAKAPTLSITSYIDGTFMTDFEKYSTDQFPKRETFRKINSWFLTNVLAKKDVNDIYMKDGYAAKIETSIDKKSVEWGINRIRYICDNYISNGKANDSEVYFSIIPDKSYYLSQDGEYPYLDYDAFVDMYTSGVMDCAKYIEIRDTLDITNFYKTDLHWKQETLFETVELLNSEMNVYESVDNSQIKIQELDREFYGIYKGQSALDMSADVIKYCENDVINNYKVNSLDTGVAVSMPTYDMDKANGRDAYEMYLGGSIALITIDNDKATTDRNLILFRDSFSSSLAPLLAQNYKKVTLVDIRYVSPKIIGNYVDFNNSDVLFIYSEQVLNSCAEQFKN